MLALVLAGSLASTPAPAAPATTAESKRRPSVLRDAALATAASAAVAMGKADIRRAILKDGRLRNIASNFADPISSIRDGTRRDSDPFWVNYVAHPVIFAAEALYLKGQGYSNTGAFAFTQVHSVVWEFAIEGSAFPPSGKDLLTDAAGAAFAIWILRPLVLRRTPGVETGGARIAVAPVPGGAQVTLTARF